MELNIEIFSWNFGESSPSKLRSILDYIGNIDTSLIVVGLQEVHDSELLLITSTLADSMYALGYEMKSFRRDTFLGSANFSLVTFIFYKNLNLIEANALQGSYMGGSELHRLMDKIKGTKGLLEVFIKFQKPDGNLAQFYLVNVHLPFSSIKSTTDAINYLLREYGNLKLNSEERNKIIIFGDFNSRSLVDDSCINGEKCVNIMYKKEYVEPVNKLEMKLNKCRENFEPECHFLLNTLVANDAIIKHGLFKRSGFEESDLHILPTYKLDVESGEYSLKKKCGITHKLSTSIKSLGTKSLKYCGRLTGYPDRIFFNSNALEVVNGYRVYTVPGNDHYPIVMTLKEKFTDLFHSPVTRSSTFLKPVTVPHVSEFLQPALETVTNRGLDSGQEWRYYGSEVGPMNSSKLFPPVSLRFGLSPKKRRSTKKRALKKRSPKRSSPKRSPKRANKKSPKRKYM